MWYNGIRYLFLGVEFFQKEVLYVENTKEYFAFLEKLKEAGCEGVAEEVEECIEDFLKAGIEPKKVMSLLGDEGVFENYYILKEYGAPIDLVKIGKNLGGDFVYQNLDSFRRKVPDMDEFIREVYDWDSFDEMCEKCPAVNSFFVRLESSGVKIKTIYSLARKFLNK